MARPKRLDRSCYIGQQSYFVTTWACRQRTGSRLWQEGFHDRALRAHDNSLSFARYVVENPVRAGLVRDVRDYPFSGSQRYELEHIMSAYQLDLKSGGIVDDAPAPHKGAPYDCAR